MNEAALGQAFVRQLRIVRSKAAKCTFLIDALIQFFVSSEYLENLVLIIGKDICSIEHTLPSARLPT